MNCNRKYRNYLNEGELLKVAAADLSCFPILIICRDQFMTQCFTGITYRQLYTRIKKHACKEKGDLRFLELKKAGYIAYLNQIIEMAGIFTVQSSPDDVTVTLTISENLGTYTYMHKRLCDEQMTLYAKTKEDIAKELPNCFHFTVRSYLTYKELDMFEDFHLPYDDELFPCLQLFIASCETSKTVNRLVTGCNFGRFSEPIYQKYADNEVYVRDLKLLLERIGIKVCEEGGYVGIDIGCYNCYDIIAVTPYLGRNTYYASCTDKI